MTGTNHGMTGAIIALLVKEPLLAVPLSFMSHFICDSIPHFDMSFRSKLFSRIFNTILATDFIIAVTMMIILGIIFPSQRLIIWACMIAAASPDLMWAYYNLYVEKIQKQKPVLGPLARVHTWVQWSQTPAGLALEVVWFASAWLVILAQR